MNNSETRFLCLVNDGVLPVQADLAVYGQMYFAFMDDDFTDPFYWE